MRREAAGVNGLELAKSLITPFPHLSASPSAKGFSPLPPTLNHPDTDYHHEETSDRRTAARSAELLGPPERFL